MMHMSLLYTFEEYDKYVMATGVNSPKNNGFVREKNLLYGSAGMML